MAPESVGPYRILHKLGSGGMGDVYLAEDTRLRRQVALKSLSEMGAKSRRATSARAGGQAVAGLNHPSIAAVYDVQEIRRRHLDRHGVRCPARAWPASLRLRSPGPGSRGLHLRPALSALASPTPGASSTAT